MYRRMRAKWTHLAGTSHMMKNRVITAELSFDLSIKNGLNMLLDYLLPKL